MRARWSPQEAALPGEEPSSEGNRGRRSAVSLRGVPVHGRRAHPAVRGGLGSDQHRLWDVLAHTAGGISITRPQELSVGSDGGRLWCR